MDKHRAFKKPLIPPEDGNPSVSRCGPSRDRQFAAAPESAVQGDLRHPLVLRHTSYARGHHIQPHWHRRAQFVHAMAGTMRVRTARHAWIVPPSRALWVPAHTVHEIEMFGTVEMHSLYAAPHAEGTMPAICAVLQVTPLAHELILRAATTPAADSGTDRVLLMKLLLDEIRRLPRTAMDLPLPASADLAALCERFLAQLTTWRPATEAAQDLDICARTLSRRFIRETGITYARWKQQARVLEAVRLLAAGTAVTTVAFDLGYESPAAFSTMFRRVIGVAPRTFAAECRPA